MPTPRPPLRNDRLGRRNPIRSARPADLRRFGRARRRSKRVNRRGSPFELPNKLNPCPPSLTLRVADTWLFLAAVDRLPRRQPWFTPRRAPLGLARATRNRGA